MKHFGAALLMLASAASALAGPAEAVAAALADVRTLPASVQTRSRYLSTYAIPRELDGIFEKVLAFHVNSLSREPDLVPLTRVGADLYRLNIDDYRWDQFTYGELGKHDPFFHVLVQDQHGIKTLAAAPWLPTAEIAELIALTQSQSPVLRADWFINQTAIEEGREGRGYYDFLGLGKTERDFQELIGADPVLARKLKKEIAGVVAKSGVTLNNRGMTRLQTINGAYWFTQDYNTSTNKQNTLRLLDGDTEPPHGDASEQYGSLANGLFATWLQNGKGERQNTAPDRIASDGRAPGTDRRVHAGLSCFRCHTEGIRPVDEWARRVYRGRIQLLTVGDPRYRRLKQLYLSDLPGQVADDQFRYQVALLRCNGLTPAENARAYGRAWEAYQEAELGPADCARELGVTVERLTAAVIAYAARDKLADPVITALLQAPPEPIRREHFDELVPVFWGIMGNKP